MKKIIIAQSMTTFGTSGNYVCAADGMRFFVKIALYALFPHDQWKLPESPRLTLVDAEIDVMRAIKTRIIDLGFTPHFSEILAIARCNNVEGYIFDKDMCDKQLIGHVPANEYPQSLFCSFSDIIASGHAIDKFALIFSEACEYDIGEYIMRYAPLFIPTRDNVIIGIIFQIYYTLVVTHRVWSQFRHGDLLPHNIRIKMMDDGHNYADGRQYLQYQLDDHVWNVPFYGFFVKIIDFGHSEIPEEGIISSVKHAKDLWIADHVAFIINFEAMLEKAHLISPLINSVLKAINTKHLTQLTTPLQLTQLAHTVKSPELALDSNIFSMFEVKVDEELVFKRYTSPPHP